MTTEFHGRSDWTGSGRGGSYLSGASLRGVACHWPGTTTDAFGVESDTEVARRLRGWRNYHVGGNGWSDIGYNFGVSQNSGIWDLRGLRRVGAHSASTSNPNANHEWIGVLFILGADEEPTDGMIEAFRRLRTEVILEEFPHATDLTGHGRAPGVPGAQTSCPGPQVAARINNGDLAERSSGEEDDMDEKGLLDALASDRGQSILKTALAATMREAGNRSTKHGRHFATNLRDAQLNAGLDMGNAVTLLNYTNPGVSNGERSVYWLLRATYEHARKSSVDLITIINLLTESGVQLDSSVLVQIEALRDEHQELLDKLDQEEPPELYPQDDAEDEDEEE